MPFQVQPSAVPVALPQSADVFVVPALQYVVAAPETEQADVLSQRQPSATPVAPLQKVVV